MYAIDFTIYRAESAPHLLDSIYDHLISTYTLPPRPVLMASLEATIEWPGIQGYYLDNLMEQNHRHIFQIRFKTTVKSREFTSLFISLEEDEGATCHQVTLRFPARGDRQCHSQVLSRLKEEKIKHPALEIEFQMEGFAEREEHRFIRERLLSAFQWEDKLRRYLHVDDRFRDVSEVKKGYIR